MGGRCAYHVSSSLYAGWPTKHDSWWKILGRLFPILYLRYEELFVWSFLLFCLVSKNWTKYVRRHLFNTIYQLSCFVGHLYIVQWTFSLFVDVCLLFCANNETAKPILIGPTFCGRSHKPRKGLRMVKFSRIVTVKNCL